MKKITTTALQCITRGRLIMTLIITVATVAVHAKNFDHYLLFAPPLEGRWDITFDMSGKPAPGWLEVRHSGFKTLVGQVVVIVGSAPQADGVAHGGSAVRPDRHPRSARRGLAPSRLAPLLGQPGMVATTILLR